MKANQLKPSSKLATVILGDVAIVASDLMKDPMKVYKYVDGKRTDEVKGFATDLVLPGQNYEKVRCVTPTIPRIFLGTPPGGAIQVDVVNPIAEITYTNEVKILADDIVLSENEEVAL